MHILTKDEFIELEPNNATVLKIEKGGVYLLADIEEWEECPYPTDRYRIEYFSKDRLGEDWYIDMGDIAEVGLYDAICEKRGFMCGGIYFTHEYDRGENNVYENLLEMFYGDEFTILHMGEDKIEDVLFYLKDGLYIIAG